MTRTNTSGWDFDDPRGTNLERMFITRFKQLAPDLPYPRREYMPARPAYDWRLDFAYPDRKIAVEAQGGIWGKGGHSTGVGIRNGYKRHNWLTAHGWRVLYYSIDMMEDDPAGLIEQLKTLYRGLKIA